MSILITGGASGLGLAMVREVAAAGAYVTIATNIETAKDELKEFEAAGYLEAFRAALRFSPTGTLDVVAIFAAVDKPPNLLDHVYALESISMDVDPTTPDIISIDVNLTSSLYKVSLTLHLQPLESQSAAQNVDKPWIFISSLAGYIDDTHNSAYTVSKFGTRGFWRNIRDWAGQIEVRCSSIAPLAMKTPMTTPLLVQLEGLGIRAGAGITFAKEETLLSAVMRCIRDKNVRGRALAIMPEGFFDIGDDVGGGCGARSFGS